MQSGPGSMLWGPSTSCSSRRRDIFNEICMFCALTSILLVYSCRSGSCSIPIPNPHPFVWDSLQHRQIDEPTDISLITSFVVGIVGHRQILLAQILTCKYDDAPWKLYKSLINIIRFQLLAIDFHCFYLQVFAFLLYYVYLYLYLYFYLYLYCNAPLQFY